MSSRWDQSEKKSLGNVPLAQHKILKDKYENLMREHESLIKTLEFLEKTHGFTVDDLLKKKREALVAKEEIEKWDNKFGTMQKKLEEVEKKIEDLMLVDETEMNGVDLGSARLAEKPNVKKSVSNEDIIEISDDDEGNQSGDNRGHGNSSHQNTVFILDQGLKSF